MTKVKLDTAKRKTQIALTAINKLHGAVERAFGERQERNQWRIDTLSDGMYLLLLSEERPDMTGFVSQFGNEKYPVETKDYDYLLSRIEPGSVWKFKLVANPTRRSKMPGERGKVKAHVTPDHQLRWLASKAKQKGFEILDETDVTSSEWLSFSKRDAISQVRMLKVSYEGLLKVTDVERFKNALICGIGRGKAYGAGMLTITEAG